MNHVQTVVYYTVDRPHTKFHQGEKTFARPAPEAVIESKIPSLRCQNMVLEEIVNQVLAAGDGSPAMGLEQEQ